MARKKFTTTIEKTISKKLKKLAVDHNTESGKMIEKMVEDYLEKMSDSREGINPLPRPKPLYPHTLRLGFSGWKIKKGELSVIYRKSCLKAPV
jgi:hypothetical protein